MFHQHQKGIKTDQIGKGKVGFVKAIELIMSKSIDKRAKQQSPFPKYVLFGDEYWIVDWRKKQVEIYELDYENNIPKYFLWNVITKDNKMELQIIHFPSVKITFDELFAEVD